MVGKSLQSNYQSFFNSFKGIINGKIRSAKCFFFYTNFLKVLDHELNPIKAIAIKFSKKLLNFNINSCKKSHGAGLSQFCATAIWNSVPVLMTTPVYVSLYIIGSLTHFFHFCLSNFSCVTQCQVLLTIWTHSLLAVKLLKMKHTKKELKI